MTKLKFLAALEDSMAGLPREEVQERLRFYSEMIDDRMEEGLTEEEAVSAVGMADEIAAQAVADSPLIKSVGTKAKPGRKLKAWEIVLLAVGSPLWITLLAAAAAVVLSLYAALWSVVVSIWAVFGSMVACAFAGVACGIGIAIGENVLTGLWIIGGGLVCGGVSIFLFYGCKAATEGTVLMTTKIVLWIKKCFVAKEGAQ